MTHHSTQMERREFTRFKVKNDIIAMSIMNPSIKGKILDISWSGLAFQYSAHKSSLGENFELIAMNDEHDICIDSLKVKTIYDVQCYQTDNLDSYYNKRCGVRFGKLSNRQIIQLEQFFLDYAVLTSD